MKRLFEVNGEFFASKFDAKFARGKLLNETDEGRKFNNYQHTITKGPDHVHFGNSDLTMNANRGGRRSVKHSAAM